MSDYSTIQQHQPLRTPQGWSGQEKALIVQLDEVFDDIYKRFGRLRLEDMNKEFRTEWADEQGNIAQLQADVGQISITVQNKYDKVSGIDIKAEGIEISGSEYLMLKTGTSLNIESGATLNIKAGGNVGNVISMGNTGMTIGSNGNLTLESGKLEIKSGSSIDIKSGSTFTVDSTNFIIDSNGKVTIKANAEFYGELKAATGTFAGTLSANCITTGTLDCSGLTVTNLSASSITTGTLNCAQPNFSVTNFNASSITTGTLNCSSLTISGLTASDIKGGTLTLGGLNNTDGKIVMKNATGTQIGIWDNTGLTATGVFTSGNWKLYDIGIVHTPASGAPFNISVNATLTGGFGIVGSAIGTSKSITLYNDESSYNGVTFSLSSASSSLQGYSSIPFSITANSLQPQTSSGKIGGSSNYWDDAYITTVHSSSSRGVKHDIRPLRDFGYEIDQLSPVSFKYNEGDDETHYGLIWEDTVGVLPVICHMDLENEDQDKAKTITYMDLIPVLLKEIQSLRKRVRALEAV